MGLIMMFCHLVKFLREVHLLSLARFLHNESIDNM